MACTSCHAGAETRERAGFPALAQCQTCHRDYAAKIPSQRIYKLPDFANFSHAVHMNAKEQCRTCHGDVWQQQTLSVFRSLKMKSCVDCHKEKHAAQACNVCHELGQ